MLLSERLKLLLVSNNVVPVFSLTLLLVSACGRGGNGWRESHKPCWASCMVVHPQSVTPLCKSQSSCAWWPRKGELTPSEGLGASAKVRKKRISPFSERRDVLHSGCWGNSCTFTHWLTSRSSNWKPVRWKLEVPAQTSWTEEGFGSSPACC